MSVTPDQTIISNRLFEIATRDPERPLVFDPRIGRFSYGQVAKRVERLAAALHRRGLVPGDVVPVQLPNWLEFMEFHLALTAIGAVTANLPIGYRRHELDAVLALTGARALVVPRAFGQRDFAPLAANLLESSSTLEQVILVGGDSRSGPEGTVGYAALMHEPWERGKDRETLADLCPGPDDLTVLGFTSGTTGELKGAMLSSRILWAWNMGLAERYGLTETERIFACSPLGHAVGLGHCLRMTFTLGASLVLLERWDPDAALPLLAGERCTFIAGATPFLMDLVYHPALDSHDDLPALRLFLCGGAAVPERLIEDAQKALPHTFVTPLWGMTECGGVTTCPYDAPKERLRSTDGLPCASMELKIVDSSGRTLPPGVDGELMARGPMRALGYFRRPELTRETFLSDGFFRTGDLARMDADGYIKITGRIKDLIVRGGLNISPVEIENVLFSHPKIANAAVVGIPDPRLGERVCAFLILRKGETLDARGLEEWMIQCGLAKQKWPERMEIVDAFPTTPAGKVQKFRLREMLSTSVAQDETALGSPGSVSGDSAVGNHPIGSIP